MRMRVRNAEGVSQSVGHIAVDRAKKRCGRWWGEKRASVEVSERESDD